MTSNTPEAHTNNPYIDRPVSQKWTWILGSLGLFAGAIAFAMALGTPHAKSSEPKTARLAPVRVSPVATGPASLEHRFFGVVQAEQSSLVAFEVGGRIGQRFAQVGDVVEVGTRLAMLDASSYQNQVQAARGNVQQMKARLMQVRRDVARAQTLLGSEAVSRQAYEQLRTEQEALEANLRSASAAAAQSSQSLSDAILLAPFAGVVTDVLVSEGDVVSAGQPVFRLVAQERHQVVIDVPQSVADALDLKVHARVTPRRGESHSATILNVSSVANARGLFPVRIGVPATLAAGTSLEVYLQTDAEPSILVPAAAIVGPTGQAPWVYTLDHDQQLKRVTVHVLGFTTNAARVSGALRPGQSVVVSGHAGLLTEKQATAVTQ